MSKVVHETVDNVFEDLKLADAEELQAKASLVFQISIIIRKKKLTQIQAASILKIDQPKISNLLRGNLAGFSTERLFRFLNLLDQDIEIVIRKKQRSSRRGQIRVLAA